MRVILRSTFVATHPGRALAIRGRAMRTFGSLVLFAAMILLSIGAYILREEFADPLTAQAVGLVVAAFVMAVAAILLYYRVKMRIRRWAEEPVRAVPRR